MEVSDAEDSPASKSKQHDIYQMNKKERKSSVSLVQQIQYFRLLIFHFNPKGKP